MQTVRTDVAVIGAGTAGLNARRQAEAAGASALLVEDGPYGTTCARVGCMPSKLLIAASDAAHHVAGAGRFGVVVPGTSRIDGRAVLERVRRERDRFAGFVVGATEALPESRRLRGRARFLAPGLLEVGDHTRVEARAVVVATGSVPVVPEFLEPLGADVLTNDSIFELTDLPESVAVVGTGVIALELGQALARLGVRTAIFGRSDHVGPATDPAVQASVRGVLGAELDLRLGARVQVSPRAGGAHVAWQARDGRRGEEHFERVLAAAGRRPRLAGLELAKAGVALDARGIPHFDPTTMQCGDAPVFLAGDATGDRTLLHEAADEGRIAGANAARFPDVRPERRRTPLAIVFTRPEIARVGRSWAELDPGEVEIGEVSYEDQGRARVMGENAGCVRVYGRRGCGTLVGAEMFGPRVEHTAHLLAWAVEQQLRVEEALACPFYHPVIEEGIQTALRDLAARLAARPGRDARETVCPGR
jgi:dihydrolipoamide dehydrogenase